MGRKRKGWLVGLVGLVAVAACLILWKQCQPEPIVLWSDFTSGESKDAFGLEKELRQSIVRIDFQEKPFSECLDWIEEKIATELGRENIEFEVSPELEADTPISLQFTGVPLTELLRYVTLSNQARFHLKDYHTIEIHPLSDPAILEIGWFRVPPFWIGDPSSTPGPIDVKSTLEEAGISFERGGFAEYNLEEELLKVQNTRDQLELVDAYFAPLLWHNFEPTWKDRIEFFWWTLKGKPGSQDISTIPEYPSTVDPFGDPLIGKNPYDMDRYEYKSNPQEDPNTLPPPRSPLDPPDSLNP